MEQTIENFTGTKNVEINSVSSQGDVQAGIEFIYHMREHLLDVGVATVFACLLYTSPSPRDSDSSRMPSSA